MNRVTNPHDRFFKSVFSQPDIMAAFLRQCLPAEIFRLIDPDSLTCTQESFVDEALREHLSDLVFQADVSDVGPGYIYLLFEHKSHPETGVAFQLLRYMVRVWEADSQKTDVGGIPPIIPVVFYHGAGKWKVGRRFSDLFDLPAFMKPVIPDFEYFLWDASRFEDEAVIENIRLRAALLILKHIFDPDLGERLPRILALLRGLSGKRSGTEYIQTILTYVLSGSPRKHVTPDDVRDAVKGALEDTGSMDMIETIADEWIEEGIQKGIQQGSVNAFRQSLLEVLDTRFGTVPESIVHRIEAVEEPVILSLLHRKALKAESIAAFSETMEIILS